MQAVNDQAQQYSEQLAQIATLDDVYPIEAGYTRVLQESNSAYAPPCTQIAQGHWVASLTDFAQAIPDILAGNSTQGQIDTQAGADEATQVTNDMQHLLACTPNKCQPGFDSDLP